MSNVYDPSRPAHIRPMDAVPTVRKRRSRMRRMGSGKCIELRPRDFEIFRLLKRYRYLRSTHIHRFIGGDRTKLIERLGALYHEAGYLDRPEQQWNELGSRYQPIVYSLSKKGEALLSDRVGQLDEPLAAFGNGNQFRHALMVCEVLADIELEANARGVRFIPWVEIRRKAPQAGPVPQISVSISHTFESGRTERADVLLTPDAVFGLEYMVVGAKSYRFFALEADRGTMPVERNTLAQSSYLKKIICYRKVLSDSLHRTAWGIPSLLILNVMPNEARLVHAMELLRVLSASHGNTSFLFSSSKTTISENVCQRVGYSDFAPLRP